MELLFAKAIEQPEDQVALDILFNFMENAMERHPNKCRGLLRGEPEIMQEIALKLKRKLKKLHAAEIGTPCTERFSNFPPCAIDEELGQSQGDPTKVRETRI